MSPPLDFKENRVRMPTATVTNHSDGLSARVSLPLRGFYVSCDCRVNAALLSSAMRRATTYGCVPKSHTPVGALSSAVERTVQSQHL